ncbi:hypothetical protein [Mitsuokella sp.]
MEIVPLLLASTSPLIWTCPPLFSLTETLEPLPLDKMLSVDAVTFSYPPFPALIVTVPSVSGSIDTVPPLLALTSPSIVTVGAFRFTKNFPVLPGPAKIALYGDCIVIWLASIEIPVPKLGCDTEFPTAAWMLAAVEIFTVLSTPPLTVIPFALSTKP